MTVLRFDGAIIGLGTSSGVRIVLGLWPASPYGPIADAMVETADGLRVLIAPTPDVGDFIAATYQFDAVRVEATSLRISGDAWTFCSATLTVACVLGRRTSVGRLLALVPRPVAASRAWCRAIDPLARRWRPGVRTYGTAGGGREEWYGAYDERRLNAAAATFDGANLGSLRPIHPPVRFGFGSTPARPSWVRVRSTVALPGG